MPPCLEVTHPQEKEKCALISCGCPKIGCPTPQLLEHHATSEKHQLQQQSIISYRVTLRSASRYRAEALLGLYFYLQYLEWMLHIYLILTIGCVCIQTTRLNMYCIFCLVDQPHNPMVNAGAIVCTSLIKVRAVHRFYYLPCLCPFHPSFVGRILALILTWEHAVLQFEANFSTFGLKMLF